MAMRCLSCRVRLIITNDFSAISKYPTIITGTSINKCTQLQIFRQYGKSFPPSEVLNQSQKNEDKRQEKCDETSSSSSSDSDSDEDEVTLEYHYGLPQITVPLPSRKERCRFTLKPVTNTVGDFLEMLSKEDKGIDKVVCKSYDGTRIAASTTIQNLLQDNFKLYINDVCYDIKLPNSERVRNEELEGLHDVKHIVSKLYEALHIQEHQCQKELELTTELETLQQELLPMEQKRNELELVAHTRSNWLAWAGLGLMSVQFGILARLTWWEYSWDIMEPVTYFVTYGTAMACYAYFVVTKQEYMLNDVRDRQYLLVLHKKAKQTGFDLNQYNLLKEQIARVQLDLRRLKDPIKLRVPQKAKKVAETPIKVDNIENSNVQCNEDNSFTSKFKIANILGKK